MVDKKSGEKSKTRPRFVKQDQVCIARLRTAGTICLETFKDFPQMGRFTLRDEGKRILVFLVSGCIVISIASVLSYCITAGRFWKPRFVFCNSHMYILNNKWYYHLLPVMLYVDLILVFYNSALGTN